MKWRKNTNLYLIILIIGTLIFAFLTIYAASATEKNTLISAKSATLYEPSTQTFLYEKNADVRLPMASTTKIMTALVAIENSNLDDLVEINDAAIGIEGSSAYLKRGDVLTMEELLYALLLQSANDAAVAIAYHIGGDISTFSEIMNDRAISLGAKDTHFENPHGLDDEDHFTTAHDLAIIAAEALKNETIKQITSTYKKHFSSDTRERNYINHNKLLNRYSNCIGVKTGFTKKSGRCLVSAAERDGLTFIAVTLDAPNDWNDHERLLDLGFDTLEQIMLAEKQEYCYKLPVLGGSKSSITVRNESEAKFVAKKGQSDISSHIKLSKFAVAPINEGDILGEVVFTDNGEVVGSVKLTAAENVGQKEKKSFWNRIFHKAQ